MRIAFYREKTTCLGPYIRFALWVQGCMKNCNNCIAPSHRLLSGGYEIGEEELAQIIIQQESCEGITISGGEPMLQADALTNLIRLVRKIRKDYGVIVYTGYTIEELQELTLHNESIVSFLNCIDLLIDGEYIDDLNNDSGYMGSSNQRLIPLTQRYQDEIENYYKIVGRKTEIVFEHDQAYLIGIPSRNTKKIWEELKESINNE